MGVVRVRFGANTHKRYQSLLSKIAKQLMCRMCPQFWGGPVRSHLFVGRLVQRDPSPDQSTYIQKTGQLNSRYRTVKLDMQRLAS